MEYSQLESRITYLDNQHRREQADIAQLRHRLDLRESEREDLLKRIETLEAALQTSKSEADKVNLLETMMDRFKSEVLVTLEGQEKKHRQALQEVERAYKSEAESQARVVSDIRRDMERGQNLDETITLARTETERQSHAIRDVQDRLGNLTRQSDEQLRNLSYIEEQRRTDVKKLGEMQNEISDLFRRINQQVSKYDLLEKQIPQFGQFQIALEDNRETIRIEIERSQHQMAQIERQVRNWQDLTDSVFRRLDEYETRMTRYAEQYQLNQKSLENLETLQERLGRDQREFTEMQRLTFDRQQTALDAFEEEQAKRLREQALTLENQVNDIRKEVKQIYGSFTDVHPKLEALQKQFHLLLRIIEEDAIARTIAAKEWQSQFEQLATEDT
ncbi:MAG: hypothetical protein AAF629_23040 [Chloroflexota bacterium]